MSNSNRPANAFEQGNQFYKVALNTGRPKLFTTPDELWDAACGYFEYCINNPIPFVVCRYNKLITIHKMRAMSMKGLGLHIGACNLKEYKKLPGFSHVVGRINDVIYDYNFTRAAAGMLKGRIISNTLR